MSALKERLGAILDNCVVELSDMLPSAWAEANRELTSEETSMAGKFSYDITPYTVEIVNCFKSTHPSRTISIMKGAQTGISKSVLESGIGYLIQEEPCAILFLTGHATLAEEAMQNLDRMIDNSGLRPLIRANTLRKKNSRTGDTNHKKEFPNGSLIAGSANNHSLLRQRSVRVVIVDDFDAAKQSDKKSGSTASMVLQRQAAYRVDRKTLFISSPELKETSNIYPTYLAGDQRKYHVPCPCCGDMIVIEWSVERNDGTMAGITWSLNEDGELQEGSVGYICQSCGDFFNDETKQDMLKAGEWRPTAKPKDPTNYSYHISSLYAPSAFFDWEHYVRQYLEACPPNQPRNEALYKTFVNVVLGLPYEQEGSEIKANELQANIRRYEVGTVPEKMSIADGNGNIVMLTCGADVNGLEDDARLDYEIVAWSESGSSYSVLHGSIGTFVPREGTLRNKVDREKWTYRHGQPNSVWGEFTRVLNSFYETDTGRKMKVFMTGLDVGYLDKYIWPYIDSGQSLIMGVKGDGNITSFRRLNADTKTYKTAKSRGGMYIVDSNLVKDDLSGLVGLKWIDRQNTDQPQGFMNFPSPTIDHYQYENYFSHFEAEHRILDKEGEAGMAFKWVKKNSAAQNHLMDCRCYNMVIKDIIVDIYCTQAKVKNGTWADFVELSK